MTYGIVDGQGGGSGPRGLAWTCRPGGGSGGRKSRRLFIQPNMGDLEETELESGLAERAHVWRGGMGDVRSSQGDMHSGYTGIGTGRLSKPRVVKTPPYRDRLAAMELGYISGFYH